MNVTDGIATHGFAFLHAADTREWLRRSGALTDWESFAASWEGMPVDGYMADGGRYRRRRHALFDVHPGQPPRRASHRPHFQTTDYNPLNGGIARWFDPTPASVSSGPTWRTILDATRALFDSLAGGARPWRVETHQFRIEARAGETGQPTPEGAHRDGVDYVLVLLVSRTNIASGTTSVHDLGHRTLGSFTLTDPLDAALVDDARVFHGVTAVEPIDPLRPAFRDVLVVTYRAIRGRAT